MPSGPRSPRVGCGAGPRSKPGSRASSQLNPNPCLGHRGDGQALQSVRPGTCTEPGHRGSRRFPGRDLGTCPHGRLVEGWRLGAVVSRPLPGVKGRGAGHQSSVRWASGALRPPLGAAVQRQRPHLGAESGAPLPSSPAEPKPGLHVGYGGPSTPTGSKKQTVLTIVGFSRPGSGQES